MAMDRGTRFAVALCAGILALVPLIGPAASGAELKECADNSPVALGLPSNPEAHPLGVGAQCSLSISVPPGGSFVNVQVVATGLGVVEGGIMHGADVQAVCGPAVGTCTQVAEVFVSVSPRIITCFARAVLAVDVDVSCAAFRPD